MGKQFGILGGGVAGLSLSYFLGEDTEVLEKDDSCGGLCRSYHHEGFTFDMGGHIIFSKDTEILDFELELLKGKVDRHFRAASVWFKKRQVKYPFENGLDVLDPQDKFDCLYNFLENPQRPQHNFEDWIYNTFGKGLADHYLIPYNAKIWKTPLTEMGTHWVERVPKPSVEDIVKSALGIQTEGYVHQLYFYYPKTGGFQVLPDSFEALVSGRIVKNFEIKRIVRDKKGWVVSNGREERQYKNIVCAMPIFDFIRALDGTPPEVQRAVDSLQYNSLIVVLVGLKKKSTIKGMGIYFPQEDLIFHRITCLDYFGENYVPPGCSSIQAEITAKESSALWAMSDAEVTREVVAGLTREGLIDAKDVITTTVRRTKYAYPIYDLHREKNLDIINAYCKSQGIELCGRFAEFIYYNSDGILRSSKTVAARMMETAS
jgi:protoporphyrinogen oxidase